MSTTEKHSTENRNVPVQTLRCRRIKAAIWQNQGAKGVYYSVTVTRSFKDGEQWRESHSFSQDELLVAGKLMYDAHTVISKLMESAKAATPAAGPTTPPPPRRKAKV